MQILVADDHALVRDGLKLVILQLESRTPIRFLEAQNYRELEEAIRRNPVLELAMVDLQMPGSLRGASLERISHEFPLLPLVVVSAFSSPDVVGKVLKLPSVHAFVPKGASHSCVLEAVRACVERRKVGEVSDMPAAPQLPQQDDQALAPRLLAVHALLRVGKSNKEIAHELSLSEGTVKNYMSEIFRRLKVVNRTQAARLDEDSPL
jgi:DNA-binding NarL/FixJ family response regulator